MPSEESLRLLKLAEERRQALGLAKADDCLVVSVVQQTLDHFRDGRHLRTHTVSTARAGTGCVEDSLRTPTGLHRIRERIGDGEPSGMVFKARLATGVTWPDWPSPEDNLITTRILRLEGLEPGFNAGQDDEGRCVDTHRRMVYIHGTNQSGRLGQPNSHGCVLLSDTGIIELYEAVRPGALVMIG
jgi:hypothetical protein